MSAAILWLFVAIGSTFGSIWATVSCCCTSAANVVDTVVGIVVTEGGSEAVGRRVLVDHVDTAVVTFKKIAFSVKVRISFGCNLL